ncbi:MAG: hypothetical protein ACM3TR_03745 [Caulobacteraceae bacterium]
MNDRLMNGFVAGIIAGIVATVADWLLIDIFRFGNLHFSDFAGYFMLGAPPGNTSEYLVSHAGSLLFLGIMGIIFNYLIGKGTKYLVFKAVLFSEAGWFFIYALALLFRVPYLARIPLNSALENAAADLVYGLVLGYSLLWLQSRGKVKA